MSQSATTWVQPRPGRAPSAPSPAPARGRPELAVVRAAQPRHALAWLVATIVLLGGAVLGAVALNALAAADSVAARALEQQVAEAERLHAELVAEVAHLDAPERIRQVAIDELGMVEAPNPRYVLLGRSLPSDGHGVRRPQGDPLKPVLAAER